MNLDQPRIPSGAATIGWLSACAASLALGLASNAAAQTSLNSATAVVSPGQASSEARLTVRKRATDFGFAVSVTNSGTTSATGVIVTDKIVGNLRCPQEHPVEITGGAPSGSFKVSDLTGAGIALGTIETGQTVTLSYSCSES